MGKFAEAEPLSRQSLEIRRRALGEDQPSFAINLYNQAWLWVATAREYEAMIPMEQATAIDDRMIGQVFSVGSERQRRAYLDTIRDRFDMFLSLVSQHLAHSPAAVRLALELVLRRKAIGAEALAAQRDAVLGGQYPTLEPKLRELITLRRQIAQKTLAGPGPEGPQVHQQLLAQWNAQTESLEAELARQIPEINLEQRLRAVDRKVVAMALPEGAVLVEFVHFRVFDFKAVQARGESLREAQFYLREVPLGQIRDRWLSEEMIERPSAGKEEVRGKLQHLARQPDDHRPFSNPFYWGAFICQGDFSPLPRPNLEVKP